MASTYGRPMSTSSAIPAGAAARKLTAKTLPHRAHGVAFVTGMQGDDPNHYRVIATPKHFAGHSGPNPHATSLILMSAGTTRSTPTQIAVKIATFQQLFHGDKSCLCR
jgi:hypothetical protein